MLDSSRVFTEQLRQRMPTTSGMRLGSDIAIPHRIHTHSGRGIAGNVTEVCVQPSSPPVSSDITGIQGTPTEEPRASRKPMVSSRPSGTMKALR